MRTFVFPPYGCLFLTCFSLAQCSWRRCVVLCYSPSQALADPGLITAEDVLGDLGVRQALKYMPKNARL
jgi:hypothetical protein